MRSFQFFESESAAVTRLSEYGDGMGHPVEQRYDVAEANQPADKIGQQEHTQHTPPRAQPETDPKEQDHKNENFYDDRHRKPTRQASNGNVE